jgi:hypothetical protein
MNLLTTLFAATIGLSPMNDDVLRNDVESLYFTDLMCSATICDRITLSGGVLTDSKYSHKIYFKPIQDKYYMGLYMKWYDFLGVGIKHDCRHTVSAYDITYDRYDLSKTFEYVSIGVDNRSLYARYLVGACMISQRYSYPRVEENECYTYILNDRVTNFCMNIIFGIRYKGFHLSTDNTISVSSYSSVKVSLEYEFTHASLGCMYEHTYEDRVYHNSINTNKLQCYVKVFN